MKKTFIKKFLICLMTGSLLFATVTPVIKENTVSVKADPLTDSLKTNRQSLITFLILFMSKNGITWVNQGFESFSQMTETLSIWLNTNWDDILASDSTGNSFNDSTFSYTADDTKAVKFSSAALSLISSIIQFFIIDNSLAANTENVYYSDTSLSSTYFNNSLDLLRFYTPFSSKVTQNYLSCSDSCRITFTSSGSSTINFLAVGTSSFILSNTLIYNGNTTTKTYVSSKFDSYYVSSIVAISGNNLLVPKDSAFTYGLKDNDFYNAAINVTFGADSSLKSLNWVNVISHEDILKKSTAAALGNDDVIASGAILSLPAASDISSYDDLENELKNVIINNTYVNDVTIVGTDEAGNVIDSGSDTPSEDDEDYLIYGLADKFPFCIPFDFVDFIGCLAADPEIPVFNVTLPFGSIPGCTDVNITIDLTEFDSVAKVIRTFELLGLIIVTMLKTRDIIRG